MSADDFISDAEDVLRHVMSTASTTSTMKSDVQYEKPLIKKTRTSVAKLIKELEPLRRREENSEALSDRMQSTDPEDWDVLEWPGMGPMSKLKRLPPQTAEGTPSYLLFNVLRRFESDGHSLLTLIDSLRSWENACERGLGLAPGRGARKHVEWLTAIDYLSCLFSVAIAETIRTQPQRVQNETTGVLQPKHDWYQLREKQRGKLRRRWEEMMGQELPRFILCALNCIGNAPGKEYLDSLMARAARKFPFEKSANT